MLITCLILISSAQDSVSAAFGDYIGAFMGHTGLVRDILLTSDKMYTASADATVKIWSLLNRTEERTLTGHSFEATSVFLSASTIYTTGFDSNVKEWRLSNGSFIKNSATVVGPYRRVLLAKDIPWKMLVCGDDGVMRIWDIRNNSLLQTSSPATSTQILDCTYLSDSNRVAAGTLSGQVLVYDWAANKFVQNLTGHASQVRRLIFTGSGELLSNNLDSTTRVWNLTSGLARCVIPFGYSSLVEHQGSAFIGNALGVVRRYNLSSCAFIQSFTVTGAPAVISLAAQNRDLFVGQGNGVITQWDLGPAFAPIVQQTNSITVQPTSSSSDTSPRTLGLGILDGGSFSKSTSINLTAEQTETDGLPINSLIAIAVAAFVMLLICAVIIWKTRRSYMATQSMKQLTSTAATDTTIELPTSITTVGTAIVTANELSIPAFLLKRMNEDYALQTFLAKGGGGSVYRSYALDPELRIRSRGIDLVCKIMADNVSDLSERMKLSFYQELSMMWRFRDDQNFVKVFAYSETPAAIIMEYCNGGDLGTLLFRPNPEIVYSMRLLVRLYIVICRSIRYLHRNGFAHCDIKPANILLRFQNNEVIPVISDFGLARVLDPASLKVKAFQVAELKGASISFAAPEVLRRFHTKEQETRDAVWKAGDVYALAVTLLEMLQRTRVWE